MAKVSKCFLSIFVLIAANACGRWQAHKTGTDTVEPKPPGVAPAAALDTACPSDKTAACAQTRAEYSRLKILRDAALAKSDEPTVARLSLQLNQQAEMLDLLEHDIADQSQYDALASKYDHLKQLLETDLTSRAQLAPAGTPSGAAKPGSPATGKDPGSVPPSPPSGAATPQSPATGSNPNATATPQTPAPGSTTPPVTVTPMPPVVYTAFELASVLKVKNTFGELYINTETGTRLTVPAHPWAGYWYPFNGDELFHDDVAPLAKFDKVLTKLGKSPGAAAAERKEHELGVPMDSWEGRCFAWAMAAITWPEPQAPATYQDVQFSVSDQKALLMMISEQIPYDQYGSRFEGDEATDGSFQDIRPEAWHQVMLQTLGTQHRPFFIDEDPGVQVWSVPVSSVYWTITKDTEKANAYKVVATVGITKYRDTVVEGLTAKSDQTSLSYTYRLYVDPTVVREGKFRVIAGEWLGDSYSSHPDTLTVPKTASAPLSNNSVISQNLDVAKQVLGIQTSN